MEVFLECWGILDVEGELWEFEVAIDTQLKDLVELLGLLGSDGFIVGIWIIEELWLVDCWR